MNGRKFILLLSAILPLSLVSMANDLDRESDADPILQGTVADATTKKPVKGVTISISVVKGQEKEKKEVVTDASGNFKIPQMPAGEILIVLEKKGYKTYRKEGVVIKEGASLKLTFDMVNMEEDESDVFHPLMRMM